jgi:hypothetical protein
MKLRLRAEVQDQTDVKVGAAKVVEKLSVSFVGESSRGFHIEYDDAVHDEVHAIPRDDHAVIVDGNTDLALYSVATTTQLQSQSTAVHVLEVAVVELIVDAIEPHR